VIDVEHLSKSYGPVQALDDVSFRVELGQIAGLLGPNGAGKTTALRIITGYMEQDAGSVRISDKDIAEYPLDVKQTIGYLPESAPSYTDMIVYEYLQYVADVHNVEDPDRIHETMQTCGLLEVAHRHIRELSKGYRQRVGLAHALIHDPKILILDEPTTGLDPNQIIEVRDLIRRISAEKTIILSTHILQEVEALCDRVVIIHRGRILLDQDTEQLRHSLGNHANLILKLSGAEYGDVAGWIREMPGVDAVSERADSEGLTACTIRTSGGEDLRPALFRLAVDKNFTIYELARETTSVEQVFRQLTTEDQDVTSAAAAE
jgi:ABC-2 type transport system ATP-binding protein